MQKIVIDNVEQALKKLFGQSILAAYPQITTPVDALVVPGKKFADYQCNSSMSLAKTISTLGGGASKPTPTEVANALVSSLPENDLVEKCDITSQGFINVFIKKEWTCGAIKRILERGVVAPEVARKEKILVDFSSPNIAKEMHVGHLRSTIIGECLCRVFEFVGHDVERINHVGDWGTQFGMLILYLKKKHPNFLQEPPVISDLVAFYKESKKVFDADPEFKDQARQEVVKLQSYDDESIKAWQLFCDLSRYEFNEIYSRLKVNLHERGESFYNKMLPDTIKRLEEKGLVEMSDGAHVIIETKQVPVNKVTQADMGRILSYYLVQVKKTGPPAWNDVFVKQLKEKGIIKAPKEVSEEDAASLSLNDMMIQVNKKTTKKFSEFSPTEDCDKLSSMLEFLYKPSLHADLVALLKERNLVLTPEEQKKQNAASTQQDSSSSATAASASSSSSSSAAAAAQQQVCYDVDVVKVPVFPKPLMVRKSDGGYTYDSTDLAAIHHRFVQEKKDRVVYVTDVGQFEHFKMVASCAEIAGWISPSQRWQHAGFGLVTGGDGKKLATRSGETTKLKDLLDEARDRAYQQLADREQGDQKQGHSEEYMKDLSKKIGYGAVKYFDLKQNRVSDYKFTFDKVLDLNGDTAVFLLYSYARICSIKKKAKVEDVLTLLPTTEIKFEAEQEKNLALAALKLGPVLLKTAEDLSPKNITDFSYDLVNCFSDFYNKCRVIGHELQNSRLLLIEVVGITLKLSLSLLGIEVAERI